MRRVIDSSAARAVAFVVLVAVEGVALARSPTVTVGGMTARTGVVVGVVAGLLLLPAVVSHARAGERRQALRWALFAVGVPLSLGPGSFAWLGVLAVVGASPSAGGSTAGCSGASRREQGRDYARDRASPIETVEGSVPPRPPSSSASCR